jgi:putative endonuclease
MDVSNRQDIGQHFEQEALHFLQDKDFRLVERNFRCRMGEIDLIMQDKEDIVFVEVRSRAHTTYGHALESVNKSKINKLIRTATFYLMQKKWLYKVNSRFDVVAFTPKDNGMTLNWVKNAFTGERF